MDRNQVAAAFRTQADWCQELGSPLYFDLMGRIANDVDRGGLCWTVLEPHAALNVLALRFLGGIHRRVLDGRAPGLARYYPSVGGSTESEPLWRAFLDALHQDADALRANPPPVVQTNEVSRCLGLLPGLVAVRRATALPFRLLEIGASGGLNLRWDHYRFATEGGMWGDPNSPVRFEAPFHLGLLPEMPQVAMRTGCDLHPVDISSEPGQLTLLSFLWPDQTARLELLRRAIQVANRVPATVEQAQAVDWIERQLARPVPGTVTVVYHSIVTMYLDDVQRARFAEIMAESGKRATFDAPLAWLSMERATQKSAEGKGEADTSVELTLWPGGQRRHIASAGFHGQNVRVHDFPWN